MISFDGSWDLLLKQNFSFKIALQGVAIIGLASVVRVEVSDVRFLVSQLAVTGCLGMKIVECGCL